MTHEQEQALTALSVPSEAFADIAMGKMVAVDLDTYGGERGIAAIQVTADRIRCGIIAVYDPGGGLPTFLQFRSHAFRLARAYGLREVTFFGASIINEELKQLLIRRGFQASHLEVPENLGGGIMEVWERTFPVPARAGDRDD